LPAVIPAKPTELPKVTGSENEFDWLRDKDDVVIETQRATAVYWNTRTQLVIRQACDWNDDEDPFVFFEPLSLPKLIERLQLEYETWKRDFPEKS